MGKGEGVNPKPKFTKKVCQGTINNCPRGASNVRESQKELIKGLTIDKYDKDVEKLDFLNEIRERCEDENCPHLRESNNYIIVCTNCGKDLMEVSNNKSESVKDFTDSVCPNCKTPNLAGKSFDDNKIYQVNLFLYYVYNTVDHLSGLVRIPIGEGETIHCYCAGWKYQKKKVENRECRHLKAIKQKFID